MMIYRDFGPAGEQLEHPGPRSMRRSALRGTVGGLVALLLATACGGVGEPGRSEAPPPPGPMAGPGSAPPGGTATPPPPVVGTTPRPLVDGGPAAPSTASSGPGAPAPVAPPVPAEDRRKRVWAPAALIKIHDKPDRDAPVIGAFRNGQGVALRDEPPFKRRMLYGCTDGWYAVEPRGWACVGGTGHGTLNGNDPAVRAAAEALPNLDKGYPFRFGVSVGSPFYLRLPTAAEQQKAEPGLAQHLAKLPAPDAEAGGAIDTKPAGRPPSGALLHHFQHSKLPLTHEKQTAYEGYKVAWTQEFDAHGRTWLLTPDLYLLPKDKVRQKPLPQLRGVDLRKQPEMALPLAFTWLTDAVKYKRDEKQNVVATDEKWPRHTFIPATGGMTKGDRGRWYWDMRDGHLAYYSDVSIIKKAGRYAGIGPKDKWVHVRVTWGYMVAYEGGTPVYATAISPGVDGISPRAHATARGKQFVDWKMLSGDMDGRDKGKDWYVDEVPWVQYYRGNYAVHGAWWHNDYGRPKSHGCINVAPADARWLFNWMDPQLPKGWYAVSPYAPVAKSTVIYIHY